MQHPLYSAQLHLLGGRLTDYLVVGEAHDVHGVQGLLEVVLVLLARDGNVAVGQEAVTVEALEKQVRCREDTTMFCCSVTLNEAQDSQPDWPVCQVSGSV